MAKPHSSAVFLQFEFLLVPRIQFVFFSFTQYVLIFNRNILLFEFFILRCIRQTERFENIIKIFSLRPLMEKIQAIISAKDTFDVLKLAAVPNYRFGTFEFLGKSHPKRVEIPQGTTSRNAAHPVSSGIFE